MKIYVHEITDQETELEFDQTESWVANAVSRVDEDPGLPRVSSRTDLKNARPIHATFSLRKVDDVVVASGTIDTQIELLCSRCAVPFQMPASPRFSSLFCQDPVMAGVAHLEGEGKPAGQNKGFARHAHDSSQDASVEEGSDLDITYLATDYIDLADLVTEQLTLQVPFQPLCSESCKGMCSNCGADLNTGRCACAKIVNNSPFSVLRDLKQSSN